MLIKWSISQKAPSACRDYPWSLWRDLELVYWDVTGFETNEVGLERSDGCSLQRWTVTRVNLVPLNSIPGCSLLMGYHNRFIKQGPTLVPYHLPAMWDVCANSPLLTVPNNWLIHYLLSWPNWWLWNDYIEPVYTWPLDPIWIESQPGSNHLLKNTDLGYTYPDGLETGLWMVRERTSL